MQAVLFNFPCNVSRGLINYCSNFRNFKHPIIPPVNGGRLPKADVYKKATRSIKIHDKL